jgi:hypothetical protein
MTHLLGECIPYAGNTNKGGYGLLPRKVHGSKLAHRAALAERLGRPVVGFALHHCDNPPCVNPDHLYEGSAADNMADASRRGRTRGRFSYVETCVHGHPFDESNTIMKPNGKVRSGIERVCRTCRTAQHRKQSQRRKAARAARKAGI